MSKIFDGDYDSNVLFKTNNEYAKNYDVWRKKEEINKIKTKYGEEDLLNDGESSSSSDDDEDGVELTEKIEKDFFKTLACLKNKDPRIYDENVKFFDDRVEDEDTPKNKDKKKKEKPMFLKDYERNLILEKGGQLSDSEDENEDNPRARSPTYVEEQKRIKENLKQALGGLNEEDDEEWGGLFKAREKTKEQTAKDDADYKEWLSGQKTDLKDKNTESELKPLKDYWNNPELEEGEKFLRDYILNKKFMGKEDDDYIPTYDEIIHDSDASLSDDEEAIEKQEEFEHKYNFRFEEPDQDFIKRYPRTVENSLRKTDDKRKVKRAETKERKQKEKQEKMQDLRKLQELKKKEIEEKIEKLKEITGNTDVGFLDDDVDGDFDPEAHDKRMQALFNDEFYQEPEDDQKPEFPDLDKELEIENWERWDGDNEDDLQNQTHCEDDNFNMDCDYGQGPSTSEELIENSHGRKKRKRKSKFAEAVSKPKPKFDPTDKTYEKYLDEYYKLDCEDIIGDIPCRFKYRKVIPNSFGLTTEEILFAKDRELNRWCSVKKLVQHRPDNVEKYDQIAFEKKAKNIDLKKKVLTSLFTENAEEAQQSKNSLDVRSMQAESNESNNNNTGESSKQKKGSTKNSVANEPKEEVIVEQNKTIVKNIEKKNNGPKKGKKIPPAEGIITEKKANDLDSVETTGKIEENTLENNKKVEDKVVNKSKKGKKKKKAKKNGLNNSSNENAEKSGERKRKNSDSNVSTKSPSKKKFKKNNKASENGKAAISDARLEAYGINPKKYKNKLKYGNK